jgi:hypothetical protein
MLIANFLQRQSRPSFNCPLRILFDRSASSFRVIPFKPLNSENEFIQAKAFERFKRFEGRSHRIAVLIDPYQSPTAVDTLGLRWINTALGEQ